MGQTIYPPAGEWLSGEGTKTEKELINDLIAQLPGGWINIPWAPIRKRSGRDLECDDVVIGPPGVFLIEVKGWYARQVKGGFRDTRWELEFPNGYGQSRESPVEPLMQKRRCLEGQMRDAGLINPRWTAVQEILVFPDGVELNIRNAPPLETTDGGRPGLAVMHLSKVAHYIFNYRYSQRRLTGDEIGRIAARMRREVPLIKGHYIRNYGIQEELPGYDYNFGTCRVFKTRDTLDRMVRVKVYSLNPLLDGAKCREIKRAIYRDAHAIMRLPKHRGIPTVYDLIDDGDRIVVPIEWIEGETLREVLNRQQGRLPGPNEIMSHVLMTIDACEVLGDVHKLGIVHRDLRPENILLPVGKPEGPIVLLNFDCAKVQGLETLNYQTIGTFGYMAPEQVRNPHDVDPRTDLYALGLILYEALTNQQYGPGCPSACEINRAVSEKLGQAIAVALSEIREARPADASVLSRMLNTA